MSPNPARDVRRVTVVGTGVIGTSWAAHFLARGLDVTATDPAPQAQKRLRQAVDRLWPTLERFGIATGASPARLGFAADLAQSLEDAEFVQESAPEDLPRKQELMRRIDAATRPGVIVASSSSGLRPSDLQLDCAHDPGRILVGHPFHPPHLMPLVEVVGGSRTDAATIDRAMAFYRSAGKHPIHIRKELPGHVANRLQAALWREAFALVQSGAATVEDVDAAIMHGPGLRWALLGPFLTLDLTGGAGGLGSILDRMGPSVQAWWDGFTTPRLDAALRDAAVEGVDAALGGMARETIEARRDDMLIELLTLKAKHGSI